MKVMCNSEAAPRMMEMLGQYKVEHTSIQKWRSRLQQHSILPGTIINLRADYSQEAIALLYALLESKCIVVSNLLNETEVKSQMLDSEIEIHLDKKLQCDFIRNYRVKIINSTLLKLKYQQKAYLMVNQAKTDSMWMACDLSEE